MSPAVTAQTPRAPGIPRPSAYLLHVARNHRANPSRAGDTEAHSSSSATTKPSAEGDTKASAPDAAGVSPRYHRATKRRLASLRLKPLSHREYRGHPHTFFMSPAITANPPRTGNTEAIRIPSSCRPRSPRKPFSRRGHRGPLTSNHNHQARSRGRHQGVHRGRRRCVPALPPRRQTTSGVPSTETPLAPGIPRPSAYLLPVARSHRKPLSHRGHRGRPHTFSLSPAITARTPRARGTPRPAQRQPRPPSPLPRATPRRPPRTPQVCPRATTAPPNDVWRPFD
jgi:hypothetical protein